MIYSQVTAFMWRWSPPPRKLQEAADSVVRITGGVRDYQFSHALYQRTHVQGPRTYCAHRSKLRLAKKFGQKDVDPLFHLPRIPKDIMDNLAEELSEINLPCKNIVEVVDKFHSDEVANHRGQQQDDGTSTNSTVSEPSTRQSSRKTASRQKDENSENCSENEERFLSFNRSPGSTPSEASTPEQEFNQHFNINEMEDEDLNQILQDIIVEDEPVSAATQATGSEVEPEQEKEPERRRSGRVQKPIQRFDAIPAFKVPRTVPRTPRSN